MSRNISANTMNLRKILQWTWERALDKEETAILSAAIRHFQKVQGCNLETRGG